MAQAVQGPDVQGGNEDIGKSALSKAGWRIIPLLALAYMVAFMDRSNISFAAATMNADLGFSATIYGIGGGLFFASYALFEVPSNIILARVGARRWIARIMITWGLIAAGMMFVRTPWQFYSMRFLLGIAEAGFFPGVIFYLSQWFPKEARGRAISRFYISGPLTRVVLGTASVWLLALDGLHGLAGWQWLFLVQGLPAVLVGLLVLWLLPGSPETVGWLTPEEKGWLARQMARDATAVGPPKRAHHLSVLGHPMVLLLGLIGFLTTAAYYTFVLNEPQIIGLSTGLAVREVGYVVSIGGLLGVGGMLFTGHFSDKRGHRLPFLFISTLLVMGAFLLLSLSLGPVPTLLAYFLFALTWGSVTLSVWMVCTDVLHPSELAVGTAMVNTMSQVGSFIAPILWGISKDVTGSFRLGQFGLVAFEVLALAVIVVLAARVRRKGVT